MPGCDNPYLEYHHFDPPWSTEQHHDPERMLALCATHHAKADALTVEQCRELKALAPERAPHISGRFDWLRRQIVAIVGGNYYYETPNIVVLGARPVIWFNRDERNHMLLNIEMPSRTRGTRRLLSDNDWLLEGQPSDVISPPNGSELRVEYPNGDQVYVKFRSWGSAAELAGTHPAAARSLSSAQFPLLSVEVNLSLTDFGVELKPRETVLGGLGGITIKDCFMSNCGAGVVLN